MKNWFSSGCTILDLAVANKLPGGFPSGRITHIFGDPSTTKSVFALEPLGAAQRKGGKAFLVDTEYSLDYNWAELNGLTIDHIPEEEKEPKNGVFGLRHPETIEELFDSVITKANNEIAERELEHICAIGIDSLTSLPSVVELSDKLEKPTFGGDRAKQFGKAYRKVLRRIYKNGLAVIAIDQTRQRMDGGGITYSGGRAIRFYADVQIFLKVLEKITNKRGKTIGVVIGFEIKKNKVAPPFQIGKFRFLFKYGIDDIGSNLLWLRENKPLSDEQIEKIEKKVKEKFKARLKQAKKSGRSTKAIEKSQRQEIDKTIKSKLNRTWFEFKGVKKRSLDDMIKHIEENNYEKRLRKAISRTWKEINKAEDRKMKVRF